ncbi:MAG: sigma-E processing peptidase SpoIIGA, partial [Pelosinus sp.]|nr:sigma-E processing peptidase SpoIIGA [Pelosinus sp.]
MGLLVLIYIAFGYKSGRAFFIVTGSFLISSFVLGGAVLGWIGLTQSDGLLWGSNRFEINVLWTHLLGGVCMGLFLLAIVFRQMFAKLLQHRAVYQITIEYEQRSISLSALLDTGNSLYGGIGKPVVLVEYIMLKKLLPDLAVQFLDSCNHNEWLTNLARCEAAEWMKRIQVIPYKAVGITSTLLGFRPDKLIVEYGDQNIVTDQVIIGIYTGVLSKAGVYTALLHSAILNQINLCAQNKEEAGICVKLGQ